MPSTYTTDLAIQLMATGENAGTWGQITNTNLVLLQQAIAGFETINIAGGAQTTALAMTQNALSNARNASLLLSGTITGNQIVTIPSGIEKTYIVKNGTSGAFTVEFKPVGGTGATWTTTDKGIKILYSDGTNITTVDLSTLAGSIVAAQITNSTITQAKLASNSIGTAQLQTNAVTAVKITQSTITQSKLAADSVGSNQLIATAVTPGTYTAATITVDADGRLTAASSGSGGAGGFIPTQNFTGPTSGTYTASPTANRAAVYMFAGGGGGGGGSQQNNQQSGGSGGSGGYGFYNKPITQPFAQPYSVGAGGNAGSGQNNSGNAGAAGGNTTIANVGTVNGGNGGNGGNAPAVTPGNPGNPGTAPGSNFNAPSRDFVVGMSYGGGGGGGTGASPGSNGSPGQIIIFENTGT